MTTATHNRLNPTALYLGDNGRCFCGNHAGATAQASGRDLSGQRVHRISAADIEYAAKTLGVAMACERCAALAGQSLTSSKAKGAIGDSENVRSNKQR